MNIKEPMNKLDTYNAAIAAVSDPNLIQAHYIGADLGNDDQMINAMSIEAVYQKLIGGSLKTEECGKYYIDWVGVSTLETVLVLTPKDGSVIFAEW